MRTPATEVPTRRWSRTYAGWIARRRWLVVAGWAVLLVAMGGLLPDAPGSLEGGVESIVSTDSAPIDTEVRSYQAFGFSLLSRTAVVQRAPAGMPVTAQARAAQRAAKLARGEYDAGPVLAAVPVANSFGLFPGSREAGTTIITWLFMPPDVSFNRQYAAGRDFAQRHYGADDYVVGVTGSVPARVEQARVVHRSLSLVELATLAAVLLVVALAFRSLVAPLVTLVVAGVGVSATLQLTSAAGALLGVAVPSELEPLLVALLLGVVTDYVVFYLAGTRAALVEGEPPHAAAATATARFTPIVAVAGLTVASGTACLLVAHSTLFRAFGPGMALTVVVGLVTAATMTPALLAILGSWVFWPRRPVVADTALAPGAADRTRRRVGWLTDRRKATGVLTTGVVLLALLALPVQYLGLGLAFVPSLPTDNDVRRAAIAAKTGFADGILSPTVLLLEGTGIAGQRDALARLETRLASRPGVAGVLGPADLPVDQGQGVVLARDGNAVRYLIVLSDDPLDAKAIRSLRQLHAALDGLLTETGLAPARAGFAGDTAIAADVVADTSNDLLRIAVTALAVNLLLLVLFLRALLAPVCLLVLNVLTLLTTLGVTTLVFQGLLHHDGVTFYVPFAAAVLLVALGSDYTIFGVGHVWDEARRRPLREALVVAVPRTAWATTTAGFILAMSFGLLALVPLRPFRELAFAMAVGIGLDAVVVRALLVPSLLALLGGASGWPTRYLHDRRRRRRVDSHPVPLASTQDA